MHTPQSLTKRLFSSESTKKHILRQRHRHIIKKRVTTEKTETFKTLSSVCQRAIATTVNDGLPQSNCRSSEIIQCGQRPVT